MIIGDRLRAIRGRRSSHRATSNIAAGCFAVIYRASNTDIRFHPSKRWRRWHGRQRFRSTSCSMTVKSRPSYRSSSGKDARLLTVFLHKREPILD